MLHSETKTSKSTNTGPRSAIFAIYVFKPLFLPLINLCHCISVDRVMGSRAEGQRFISQISHKFFLMILNLNEEMNQRENKNNNLSNWSLTDVLGLMHSRY